MTERLDVLYRGPLSSCNYDCAYCPFAKRASSRTELVHDADCLSRFVSWSIGCDRRLGILFTPWGEALIRRHYREAMIALSRASNVERVAAQTNLSCDLAWLERADRTKTALWATYHPTETPHEAFVAKIRWLAERKIRVSVGIVGLAAHREAAEHLRRELPAAIYLWVNAAKSYGALDGATSAAYQAIDPLFTINTVHHRSRGEACRTGESAISVDGDGNVRRCHFVPELLGNLYRDRLSDMLAPRPCPNERCGCHIGYVHLTKLGLREKFGAGLLERIPESRL